MKLQKIPEVLLKHLRVTSKNIPKAAPGENADGITGVIADGTPGGFLEGSA